MSYWICVIQDICPITVQMKVSPCTMIFEWLFGWLTEMTRLPDSEFEIKHEDIVGLSVGLLYTLSLDPVSIRRAEVSFALWQFFDSWSVMNSVSSQLVYSPVVHGWDMSCFVLAGM